MLFPHVESGLLAGALPYVRFGEGEERLVIFPGIGDALQAVTASPRSQAWFFRRFGRTFTVYLIGRKRNLPTEYSTRDMAVDHAKALAAEVGPSHVLGLSMGALIAQHLAADFPAYVRGLVLILIRDSLRLSSQVRQGHPTEVPEEQASWYHLFAWPTLFLLVLPVGCTG